MQTPWLFVAKPSSEAPCQLICIPHSGAPGTVFRPWALDLAPEIEVSGVQLPGRGVRWQERAVTGPEALMDGLVGAVQTQIDRPFAVYGHSFGALCAFELCRELRHRGLGQPVLLAVSGRGAPHMPTEPVPSHDLPREQMISELTRLGGMPVEVLADNDILDSVLPAIRADFRLLASWQTRAEPPLDVPIVAFRGADDPIVSHAAAEGWGMQTRRAFDLFTLRGSHFFGPEAVQQILAEMRGRIRVSGAPTPVQ